MPVQLEWHATLPILMLTYNGILSQADCIAACKQRQAMLDRATQQVIVVADCHQMEEITGLDRAATCTPLWQHPRVYRVLIVLPDSLFRLVRRAVDDTAAYNYRVQFFRTVSAALDHAQRLVEQLSR